MPFERVGSVVALPGVSLCAVARPCSRHRFASGRSGARSGLACPQQRPPSPLRAPRSVAAHCTAQSCAVSAAPRVERVRLSRPVRSSWSSYIIPWPGRSFALDRPGVAYAKKPARWKRSRPRPPLLFLRVAGFRNVSTTIACPRPLLLSPLLCLHVPPLGVRSTPPVAGSSWPASPSRLGRDVSSLPRLVRCFGTFVCGPGLLPGRHSR